MTKNLQGLNILASKNCTMDVDVDMGSGGRSIIKEVSYKVAKATGVPVKSVDVYVDTVIIG